MAETNGSPKFKVAVTGKGIKVDQEIDQSTVRKVLDLIFGGEGEGAGAPEPSTPSTARGRTATRRRGTRPSKARSRNGAKGKPPRRSSGPGIVKDLSLRPKGKKAFADFVTEKQPETHQEQQTLIVYWLKNEAGMSDGITVDHVNTCYRAAGWRRPTNLRVSLATNTAAKRGWLDTSEIDNIRLTPPGEDMVVHDLPRKPKSEK